MNHFNTRTNATILGMTIDNIKDVSNNPQPVVNCWFYLRNVLFNSCYSANISICSIHIDAHLIYISFKNI